MSINASKFMYKSTFSSPIIYSLLITCGEYLGVLPEILETCFEICFVVATPDYWFSSTYAWNNWEQGREYSYSAIGNLHWFLKSGSGGEQGYVLKNPNKIQNSNIAVKTNNHTEFFETFNPFTASTRFILL